MAPKDEFQNNIKLVQEVEKYPCLYNSKLEEYSRRDITDRTWEIVANKMNDTVSNCKEKWRNLRTVFVRKLKSPKCGPGRKPYYLMDMMKFIVPYLKSSTLHDLPCSSTLPALEIDNLVDTPDYINTSQLETSIDSELNISHESVANVSTERAIEYKKEKKKKKKKSSKISEVHQTLIDFIEAKKKLNTSENDARKYFLLSLLPDVQKLTDIQMRIFKRKVLVQLEELLDDPVEDYVQNSRDS